jgi:hypothetical protein
MRLSKVYVNERPVMVTLMDRMRTWIVWIILLGVALDLAISGVLTWQVVELQHVSQAAHCWDHVLDEAILGKPANTKSVLLRQANHCAGLVN